LGVPITFSVLPDVHYTATIAREASAAGMGVMLHLPMETVSGLNPGPGKVTTEMTDDQIVSQVQDDLAQVPLARGVNNHEGSKASADERVMHDVVGVLAKRGDLFFIDSRTSPQSVGEQVARAQGVPSAGRDVFLDNQETVAYTEGQLREAIAIAKRTGSAIAIGHPRPTTLEALKAMIPELQSAGIQLVLAQDLVGR
ncbi:MAG TPA: divergent polysaccharide deacetylase family protein, partial [Candidatus Cybelea sp.]|nr:divergent polysaccharide deacetylase family protein [Candidatus Cybelea sp.]